MKQVSSTLLLPLLLAGGVGIFALDWWAGLTHGGFFYAPLVTLTLLQERSVTLLAGVLAMAGILANYLFNPNNASLAARISATITVAAITAIAYYQKRQRVFYSEVSEQYLHLQRDMTEMQKTLDILSVKNERYRHRLAQHGEEVTARIVLPFEKAPKPK